MRLVLISGMSGSGKSIALNLLEDSAYTSVDNLPTQLLPHLVEQFCREGRERVAVAIDIRDDDGIAMLPRQLDELRARGIDARFIFLDAKEETLIRRYSETRRRHPLATAERTLIEAIAEERRRLEGIVNLGHHIDTSDLRPNALREWIRQLIAVEPGHGLTLMFESFGFKHGLPLDADLVFDVRCLPNPHYDPLLKPLTGRDGAVVVFLEAQPEVMRMREDIRRFVADWLPCYVKDNRSYLTVAIGCTGGQHRSVYLAEYLGSEFHGAARVLVRHRELGPLGAII